MCGVEQAKRPSCDIYALHKGAFFLGQYGWTEKYCYIADEPWTQTTKRGICTFHRSLRQHQPWAPSSR